MKAGLIGLKRLEKIGIILLDFAKTTRTFRMVLHQRPTAHCIPSASHDVNQPFQTRSADSDPNLGSSRLLLSQVGRFLVDLVDVTIPHFLVVFVGDSS